MFLLSTSVASVEFLPNLPIQLNIGNTIYSYGQRPYILSKRLSVKSSFYCSFGKQELVLALCWRHGSGFLSMCQLLAVFCRHCWDLLGVTLRWGPLLESPGNFSPLYKAIFSSSLSKNGEVYTPETSCLKATSVHVNYSERNSSVIAGFEILPWFYGPEKIPGLSRTGPLD